MRNHGFLIAEGGWSLVSTYDVYPNDQGGGLNLNISKTDNTLDFGLFLKGSGIQSLNGKLLKKR